MRDEKSRYGRVIARGIGVYLDFGLRFWSSVLSSAELVLSLSKGAVERVSKDAG